MSTEAPDEADGPARRKGFSLGFKFSLVLILTLCILVTGAGTAFYHLGVRQIDEEIDKRGATLVTTLAGLGSSHWNATLVSGKATETLQGYIRLPATEHEVFDLILLSAKNEAIKAAKASGEIDFKGGTSSAYAADPSIQVTRDRTMVDVKSGAAHAVRVFQIPVRGTPSGSALRTPEGELPPVASVMLVMNAEPIERAKTALRNSVMITAIVAILLGGAVAFWLASFVTNPLKLLMKDIRVVSAGNLDHHTRTRSSDEIGELAETFNHMTLMMRVAREADLERQTIEHDLDLARQIQSNLLPKKLPKIRGMDLQAFYRSAKEVGGDYYDLIPLTAQHLGIAVGDVSGKGVQGSLVMAMTRSVLRSVAPGVPSAAKTLIRVNHTLSKDLKPGSFVTLIYLVVDVVARTLNVARAGHNPLLIYHGEKRACAFLNPSGIALGFDAGPIFEKTIREATVPLAKGDVIVAYTDGVVESMDTDRTLYGNDRFQQVVQAHAHEPATRIVQALVTDLDRHQGSAPQHDDISIVVLKVL
jgi:serine phosphatase RsbU (regulator of sigma subunit)